MSDTLELLMDAAESGIRKRGYNAISFRELAAELGIKSASVHYHFPRKEDLGIALVKRYSKRFFSELEANLPPSASSRDRLSAIVATYREALHGSDAHCLCGVLGAESSGLPELVSKAVADFFEKNISWVAAALPDGWSGERRHGTAQAVVSTLQGAMMISASLGNKKLFDNATARLPDLADAG